MHGIRLVETGTENYYLYINVIYSLIIINVVPHY